MIDSIQQYWYLWLVLIALILVVIWASSKASKAVKKRYSTVHKQEEEMKRYKYLIDKYSTLTVELAEQCDPFELAEGVTAVLQRQIEKAVHMNEEFNSSELWRRTVYALYYLDEDSRDNLSFFFKNNGEPVLKLASDGVSAVGEKSIAGIVSRMYSMYDEKNESVSIDEKVKSELNEKFKAVYDRERFFENIKGYIITNLQGSFLN